MAFYCFPWISLYYYDWKNSKTFSRFPRTHGKPENLCGLEIFLSQYWDPHLVIWRRGASFLLQWKQCLSGISYSSTLVWRTCRSFLTCSLSQWMHTCGATNVNGAAEQRAPLHSPADDAVEVRGGFSQLVHLCHAASEVLKAFWSAAADQSLVAAVQPDAEHNAGVNVCVGYIHKQNTLEDRMFPLWTFPYIHTHTLSVCLSGTLYSYWGVQCAAWKTAACWNSCTAPVGTRTSQLVESHDTHFYFPDHEVMTRIFFCSSKIYTKIKTLFQNLFLKIKT